MDPWVYGAIALVIILGSLLVVWMFRHTAQVIIEGGAHRRHGAKSGHDGHSSHGTSGGGHH